ncbi:hypothetical protein GLOIN_2v1781633 [Rhizophagus irregularis DAOM 181602=DAOM 197198]|uniref:Uncharacterized protein n=1 Tax=Rhizophagus irregularis (strain DAOM 181602 / DAOM 197198 / MUCL 43194) TaxID=747089 RepID=A0A2P4PJG4_RHIID|nr:hypothetical protein GLOIN_2v1781633 [Rhizophagus irregularis DAOM 181602=DAOM 197198]POG65487.1 hypothetical protein GLOIN_2v1781633 [Rhizophagus irregularis DAOM 181602=DAOM 197198]|eukprot:XP_025172353.1 hypothetical protein GLOIN_2v1781633 [Rhizophagus irregularis DAOM 181602=DAOM 197198]
MSDIRYDLIRRVIVRAVLSINYNIHNDFHKQHEFMQQAILDDNSLTEEEKAEAPDPYLSQHRKSHQDPEIYI